MTPQSQHPAPHSKSHEVRVDQLLQTLDQAFDKASWHGTNLGGSIRGVDTPLACWRPNRQRHNIWEIVVHAAYWKYIVRRRLLGEKRRSFPLKGSNWFERPSQGFDWKEEVRLLGQTHRSMRAAVASLKDDALELTPTGSKVSNMKLISGAAAHDVYHAGQIQLLKRLAK